MFGLLNPVVGLHEYEVPPVAFSVVEPPQAMVTLEPALATGDALTVMVTVEVEEQVPFDTVTV